MKQALAGFAVGLAAFSASGRAAPALRGADVNSLVQGVVTGSHYAWRQPPHSDPKSPSYIAVELGSVRFIASARTAKIVGRKPAIGAGRGRGMVGSWAAVKVIPLDRQMHDMAEGDLRLMHRQQGMWRAVAGTDEGNGFSQAEMRRVHMPASVIRRLHLEVHAAR